MITSEVIISLFKIWPYPEKPNNSKPIHFHWNIFILLNSNPDLGINFLSNHFKIDWNPKTMCISIAILKCSIFFKIYTRLNLGVFAQNGEFTDFYSFHSPGGCQRRLCKATCSKVYSSKTQRFLSSGNLIGEFLLIFPIEIWTLRQENYDFLGMVFFIRLGSPYQHEKLSDMHCLPDRCWRLFLHEISVMRSLLQ